MNENNNSCKTILCILDFGNSISVQLITSCSKMSNYWILFIVWNPHKMRSSFTSIIYMEFVFTVLPPVKTSAKTCKESQIMIRKRTRRYWRLHRYNNWRTQRIYEKEQRTIASNSNINRNKWSNLPIHICVVAIEKKPSVHPRWQSPTFF